jgi:protein subunit release factor B
MPFPLAVTDRIVIPASAVETRFVRASGPGGQHVNKVSSAVRIHHLPSGIVVRCAGERSQRANLDEGLRRLAALLADAREAERARAERARRRDHHRVERGRPVRTYILAADGALKEQPR